MFLVKEGKKCSCASSCFLSVCVQGASGLQGKLKEDFQRLVQQHRHEEASSTDSARTDREEMCESKNTSNPHNQYIMVYLQIHSFRKRAGMGIVRPLAYMHPS